MTGFWNGFIWGLIFGTALIVAIVRIQTLNQRIITYPAEAQGQELWLVCDLKGQHPNCQWSE